MANIALHGLENIIKQTFSEGRRRLSNPPKLIRYADDLVVLHEDRAIIEQCQTIISEWLNEIGLTLKPSKTKISHTLENNNGEVGFNFLGFNIRQYQVGKTRSSLDSKGRILGFKINIKPSQEAVKRHYRHLVEIINQHRNDDQVTIIQRLNPIIRGWSRYFSNVCSKATFNKVDSLLFAKLRAWAIRRHPNKGKKWVMRKYWKMGTISQWIFSTTDNSHRLYAHANTPINRYMKVQGNRSPYDGDWVYWSTRMGRFPTVTTTTATLLKKQQGKCFRCGLYFNAEDILEVDHIIPKSMGGNDAYYNWQLLHRHCHDEKTAQDCQRYV